MNLKLKHFIIFIFSLALLGSMLFISGKAENAEELKNVKFGIPLKFIGQDFSESGVFWFPDYPRPKISWPPQVVWFSWKNFMLSFSAIFISLEILIFILEWLDFKIRNLIYKE